MRRKTRVVLLLVVLLAALAAVGLEGMRLLPSAPFGAAPADTLDEKIAAVEAVSYEEIAPYLEARFVFHPHTDGLVHARWCDDNNFDKLPERPDHKRLIWLANDTTERYIRARTEETHFCYFLKGERPIGDSPWGAFTEIGWLRGIAEPLFEESKQDYIGILRKLDSEEQAGKEATGEVPSAVP